MVLSDGTIIGGHQRVAALKKLGRTHVLARVMDEEYEYEADDVVDLLISDNLNRRQLSDIQMARCYAQLKKRYACEYEDESGDVRDILADRLRCGRSGRTLDRLSTLLTLPNDIVNLIDSRELTQTAGLRILKMSPEKQAISFTRLRSGEPWKTILSDLDAKSEKSSQPNSTEIGLSILKLLAKHRPKLENCLGDLDRVQLGRGDALAELEASIEFLTRWRDRKLELRRASIDDMSS